MPSGAGQFGIHSECTKCNLHESATHPGLPARPSDLPVCGLGKALLVIGEAPGYHEDRAGKIWVGASGKLLHKMLSASGIDRLRDIYLTNACRCLPPHKTNPSISQARRCYDYLRDDILALYRQYSGDLAILCTGATACQALLGLTLKAALDRRGNMVLLPHPTDEKAPPIRIPVFATYHPAAVLHSGRGKPGRSLLPVIRDHFTALRRFLDGQPFRPASRFEVAIPCPNPRPSLVAVDIETYGALSGRDQTVFHPVKSIHIDQVSKSDLIQTVAFSWGGPNAAEHSAVFNWQDIGHRMLVESWFGRLAEQTTDGSLATLIGQNLVFDLMYLRHCSPYLHYVIRPGNFRLEDVQLWSFLHNELRPERGLKALARLFALARYGDTNFNYERSDDPRLYAYNALDTQVTLRARSLLLDAIARDYKRTSPKLSDLCRNHCSDILWAILHMSEAGVPYDVPKLQALRYQYEADLSATVDAANEVHSLRLCGPGSARDIQALIDQAASECSLRNDSRLLLTDKTKLISTKDTNLLLLLETNPPTKTAEQLTLLRKFRDTQKLLTTYLRPLLDNPVKGIVSKPRPGVGLAYPTWYACPSKHELDEDKEGGQIQGRLSAKKPAFATSPPQIKACRTTRFVGGSVIMADYKQVEWRVAGLLSGDDLLLDEFASGFDPHAVRGAVAYATCLKTDEQAFWSLDPDSERYKQFRQMGKTINFLALYGGQAAKLAATIRSDVGYLITDLQAQRVLDAIDSRYVRLRQWQDELVAHCAKVGRIEVLTGWSRTFLGGQVSCEANRSAILNFPVQTIAAQLLQSAQVQIAAEFDRRALKAVIDMNIYDAIHVDTPPHERSSVHHILAAHLPNPPLLADLAAALGRIIPLAFDTEEK